MNVPRYASAESARDVKYFQVVVVSRLPHFKKEEHSEDDIVQFMVSLCFDLCRTNTTERNHTIAFMMLLPITMVFILLHRFKEIMRHLRSCKKN